MQDERKEFFDDRVILYETDQKDLLRAYILLYGSKKDAAESLGITKQNLYEYEKGRVKSLPRKVFDSVLQELRDFYNNTDELSQIHLILQDLDIDNEDELIIGRKSLEKETSYNFRNWSRRKTPEEVREINEGKAKKGRKALKKKYGDDCYKILHQNSVITLRDRYGPNFMRELRRRSEEVVLDKYGKEGYRLFGTMSHLGISKKYLGELEERGAIDILEFLAMYDMSFVASAITRNLPNEVSIMYVVTHLKPLVERGFVEKFKFKTARKQHYKLSENGQKLLDVYYRLRSSEEKDKFGKL